MRALVSRVLRTGALLVLSAMLAGPGGSGLSAQDRTETFLWEAADGATLLEVAVFRPGGAAMLRLGDLGALGASVAADGNARDIQWGDHRIELVADVPVVVVDDAVVQLALAPVDAAAGFYVPLQLFTDVLPDRAPDLMISDGSSWRAIVVDSDAVSASPRMQPTASDPDLLPVTTVSGPRVIVIDPGHGGPDPGAVGPTGVREKDVALAVGTRLAAELMGDPDFEVYLTRREDELVPLWERGPTATELKGERPGLFLSIHMNSVSNRSVRGFETYFLGEARTEDARRLQALENAAMAFGDRQGVDLSADPELGSILNELRNFDHQHWSADLAAEVQTALEGVHPARNRGVKQGLLAVITNSIMPSVLIELGFISNPEEEQMLASEEFQQEAAEAIADAVREFFERYPPGGQG